jgi:type II secretory pathway predicted ATPase ExeA
MHIAYWGLTHSPFASQLDPKDYYPSGVHEEAMARLDFLIANSRRLGFLLGGAGTGKSLLLEVAARQLRRNNCQLVKFNVVGLTGGEFIWKLSQNLGRLLPPLASPLECWRGIHDQLNANRYQRRSTVVLLDDVDEAAPEVHAAISRLALFDPHPDARLTIILTAQRQRASALGGKLNELCDLCIDLQPLDELETAGYLEHALQHAGATRPLFQLAAVERIYEYTRGVPRKIRQLAELSLLAGAAEALEEVTPGVVESVQHNLTSNSVSEAA